MFMHEKQAAVRQMRGEMPSPGRPTVGWRQDRVAFLAEIAKGEKTDDAAVAAGVSSPVGYRWFRHAGGVNPCLSPTVSGRYLSFSEREDIALYRVRGPRCSVQLLCGLGLLGSVGGPGRVELGRDEIPVCGVRPVVVVVDAPVLDQHSGFKERVEDPQVQQLVA